MLPSGCSRPVDIILQSVEINTRRDSKKLIKKLTDSKWAILKLYKDKKSCEKLFHESSP